MPKFFSAKLTSIGGDPKQSQLVRFGGSKKIAGVTITTVPAVHSNGIAGAMIGGELGDMLDESGLTAYAGPPTGYVVTSATVFRYISPETPVSRQSRIALSGSTTACSWQS
jgi:hypothetical protein